MEKKLTLRKEHISSIKYFIKHEIDDHKYGSWDKFTVTSLKIHANGFYSFKVHWLYINDGKTTDDYWLTGNLFDEFPVQAVYDGLDAIQLLFHKIHIKAYERLKEHANRSIENCNKDFEYLKEIYKQGTCLNKENKIIQ